VRHGWNLPGSLDTALGSGCWSFCGKECCSTCGKSLIRHVYWHRARVAGVRRASPPRAQSSSRRSAAARTAAMHGQVVAVHEARVAGTRSSSRRTRLALESRHAE
jgi:hypothetical protein